MSKGLSLIRILLQEQNVDSEHQENEIDDQEDGIEIYRIYDRETGEEVNWEWTDEDAYWWIEDNGGEDKYRREQEYVPYKEYLDIISRDTNRRF